MKNRTTTVVLFKKGEQGARIYKNPPHIEKIKQHGKTFIDPDLTKVKGLPPVQWKISGGRIVPNTPPRLPEGLGTKIIITLNTLGLLYLLYKEEYGNIINYAEAIYDQFFLANR